MGRKSALAGLWAGGGKGIIPSASNITNTNRQFLLEDYGRFITSIRGCYVAAEDVGITVSDVDVVFSKSRFITCISSEYGGSGNPSIPTALGVKVAMESALDHVHGASNHSTSPLQDKVVAVQGLGNVGNALVGFLLDAGVKRVIGCDISADRIDYVTKLYASQKDRVTFRREDQNTPIEKSILTEECDIFSPCAYGGILNHKTVPLLKAKIICGAANNQLLDCREDYDMHKNGIIYVPDYVCNRMGIVNCANEQYGSVGTLGQGTTKDPIVARYDI